jgi:hypothetical protein
LDQVLRRVHARARRIETAVQVMRWLAIFLVALIGAFALDAWLAFSPAGLVTMELILGGMALFPVFVAYRIRRQNPYQVEQMAFLVHERLALPAGRLINAVDFSIAAPPGASTTLVNTAIHRGEELAAAIDPGRVISGAVLRRASRWVAGVCLVGLVFVMLEPAAFRAVGLRLLHPLSDLPPFTGLTFEVSITPEQVYVGQGAEIRVRVTGPSMPPEASVVLRGQLNEKTRAPMWRETLALPHESQTGDTPQETFFSLKFENLGTSTDFYIDTADGRSGWQRVEVLRNPLVEKVTLHYTPPEYTGWKPVFEAMGGGGIRALRRTRVSIHCRSNVPLGSGRLLLQPSKEASQAAEKLIELKPDPADAQSVTGAIEVEWSGSLVLAVKGRDGLPGAKEIIAPLVCVPDQPPQVAIVAPEAVSMAPEGWKVPVQIEASDDVGLAELTLMTRVNAGKFVARVIPAAVSGSPESREVEEGMDLTVLGAVAGDKVRYFAMARDNEPQSGKTCETPVQTLVVVTMEEYRDIARAGYRIENMKEEWQQFLEAVDALAGERDEVLGQLAELEKQRKERGGASPADHAKMQALENALRNYQEQLGEAGEAMRQRIEVIDLYDVDQVYKKMLSKLADQLDRQKADASSLEQALTQGEVPDFEKAAAEFRSNKAPFEKTAAPAQLAGDLDKIDKAARMGFQAACLQSIIEGQRELAERLASAVPQGSAPADRARLEKLGDEQRFLEKKLRETVDELARLSAECKEALPRMSASAGRLVRAARKLEAWNDQALAAGACPDQPQGAAEYGEVAAEKLETLLSECRSNSEGGDELDGCLSLCKNPGAASARQMIQGMKMGMKMGMTGQGGMGGGAMGAMATMGLVGPRLPSTSKSVSARSGEGKTGQSQQKKTSILPKQAGPAGAIVAESTLENPGDARQIPGVPQAYRDLAEAYFRRLARDAAGLGDEAWIKAAGENRK